MQSNRMFPAVAGAAVAAVLIAVGVPLASLLPFALLLVCPLMMVLMMRRMSGSHGEDHSDYSPQSDSARKEEAVRAPAQSTEAQ